MNRAADQPEPADWSEVAAAIEALHAAWEAESAIPSLTDFVPPAGSASRQRLLLELIKVDMEQRWSRGLRRLVEDYAADFPELSGQVPGELIFEEYHIRRIAGDPVSAAELAARFPQQRQELASLLAVSPSLSMAADPGQPGTAWKHIAAGQRLGDFDLLLELGQGSFARVFFARQRSMQRLVAVKVSSDCGTEGATLAQLDHDHIVRVYDQQLIPEQNLRLLYMQYLPGGTLADVIRRLRQIPREEWRGATYLQVIDQRLNDRGEHVPAESALRSRLSAMSWPQLTSWIGARLASALAYAHQQQILHRDLKPANILLTAEGIPRLADFNISFCGQLEAAVADAQFGGSLAYMSPEQLDACDPRHPRRADSLDERSDIYSLGVLLWELLHGRRPFPEAAGQQPQGSLLEQARQQRSAGSSDWSRTLPRTDEVVALEQILQQCLHSAPAQRPPSAAQLELELNLCQDPEARRLLAPQPAGWRRIACNSPIVVSILLTLLPNLVGAVFNFFYNLSEVRAHVPEAVPQFMQVQRVINAVAFPVGIAVGSWLVLSVARTVRTPHPEQLSATQLQDKRRRCLKLGWLVGGLSLSLWLLAAPAYPLALHALRGQLPAALYGHFLASLALCGLIACAYPFLSVSCVAVRCFYPRLVQWNSLHQDDVRWLERLAQNAWLSILLAALVPMLAAGLLVLVDSGQRSSLLALTVGGAASFGLAVSLFRWLQRDIQTLCRALTTSLSARRR